VGIRSRHAFGDYSCADFDKVIAVNLRAAFLASQAVLPAMRKQGGGRIINITNIGAKQPGGGSMPTTLSRAAGLALTKSLSKEFAPENILVNTICIGKIKSGQHERTRVKSGISADEYYAKGGKEIPMGRFGEAEEAANAIVYLASSAASYVTGTSMNLDGGLSGVL